MQKKITDDSVSAIHDVSHGSRLKDNRQQNYAAMYFKKSYRDKRRRKLEFSRQQLVSIQFKKEVFLNSKFEHCTLKIEILNLTG